MPVISTRQIGADHVIEHAGEHERNEVDQAGGRIEREPGKGKDPIGKRGAAVKRVEQEGARKKDQQKGQRVELQMQFDTRHPVVPDRRGEEVAERNKDNKRGA